MLGAAQEVSGHQAQAEAAFTEGIARFPKEDDNYLDRAALAVKDQDYATAGNVLAAGLEQIPKSYKLFLTRGVVYSLQGNLKKAQADYEALLRSLRLKQILIWVWESASWTKISMRQQPTP